MKKFLDIPYANESNTQKLDLYLPNRIPGPYPLIFFIHGGGWQIGDKRDDQYKAWIDLVNNGYALASINYRMSPESVHPDGIFDCKKALNYLRDHKDEYDLDMDNVGVVGSSAGGHYALMLATTVNHPRFLVDQDDVPIKCAAVWYAPTDFYNGKKEVFSNLMNRIKYGIAIGCIEKYFGRSFASLTEGMLMEASPVTYINSDLPPILLQQGDKDFINPPSQAKLFYEAAKRKGVEDRVTVEIFKGAGHVDPQFEEPSNKLRLRKFLDAHLKK